jgi:hypothetical protein
MRPVLALILALEVAGAPAASAQSSATLIPSVSVSTVHDDNLFSAASGGSAGSGGEGIGDFLTYIRPSLEGTYESPTFNLQSLMSIDLQRSLQHASLNTFDARRHAMFDGRVRTTPSISLGLGARYDRTETAGDLNFDTGILLERRAARRIQLTPSLAYRVVPRTTLTTQYDWTDETLSGGLGIGLHAARIGVARAVSPLTTLSGRFTERLFVGDSVNYSSHVAMFGWAREIGPGTNLSLQAGPRLTSYNGISSEVQASFIRRTPRTRFLLDYWLGETIVLGIPGPVEVHSAATKMSWAIRRNLEVGTHLAVFNSRTLEESEAMVYHASLVTSWSRQPYILSMSYGADLQRGDIRTHRSGEEEVRRGVFLVRLTIAPRLSRAFRPPDAVDQPTTPNRGVTQ